MNLTKSVNEKKNVLALGFFDSIHKGHRYLLQEANTYATEHNANLVVITFNDNFLKNLNRPFKEVYLLNERLHILNELGYHQVFVLDPTKEFLDQSQNEFMQYLLTLNPIAIVAGSDYTFGKNRQGNIDILTAFMNENKVEVRQINLLQEQGVKIASTDIKQLLTDGNITVSNELLGGNYFISGIVVKGRGAGGALGMPTANINVHPFKQIPKEGVYQTTTEIDNKLYCSITNVGVHPTFECNNFNIETLILDFNQNLYKKEIKVYFHNRIRDIIKFSSPIELVKQVKKDISMCYNK